jgi:hypothetical protein
MKELFEIKNFQSFQNKSGDSLQPRPVTANELGPVAEDLGCDIL